MPGPAEIVRLLPRKLQLRFESLGSYVRSLVGEEQEGTRLAERLSQEQMQFIQLAALVFSLDGFLRDGTRAARAAATTFEHFNLPGFAVGRTTFTKDNEDTLRGERLADGLRAALQGTGLLDRIDTARTMRDLVQTLIAELERGNDADTLG